jgi:hypothetical protein
VDRIIADFGLTMMHARRFEVARQAFVTVYLTAKERLVRWNAAINALELSAHRGSQEAFHFWHRILRRAPLPGRLLALRDETAGRGFLAFGNRRKGGQMLRRAAKLAARYGFDAQVADAFDAMRTETTVKPFAATAPIELDVDVAELLEAVARHYNTVLQFNTGKQTRLASKR